MVIPEKKIESNNQVINDIINWVKNFKAVTTDQDFIEFLEQLEIIKFDLELFWHIEEWQTN